jgi:hypothetical protein
MSDDQQPPTEPRRFAQVIRRRMTLSPSDRLIGACETALARLEASRGDPPRIFAETGEVLFWLYAIGDTGGDNLLSPGFQWARHQYAHGNLITEAVEHHQAVPIGRMMVGPTPLGMPWVHRWMARTDIGTYAKARKPTKTERDDYDARLSGKPVIATLWDELSKLVANVNPRDLAPDN